MSRVFRSEAGQRLVHERYRALLQDWPAHEERRIPTCQGETFVLACGPLQAPPLVLLHGGATTSAMWTRNIGAWAVRFRVYAVDLIGEPGFSAPSRPPWASDAHARWLDDVWRGLALTRAAVAGASQGGWIALDYAIRRPANVQCLALLAPAGVGRVRPSFAFKVAPLLMLGAWGRRKALDLAMGLLPEEMSAEERDFMRFFEMVMAQFVYRTAPFPVFTDAMLRTLTLPVLAVVGGKDAIFRSDETRRRLVTCVPQSRVHYLPAAGHGLTDQTATVLEFLCKHPREPAELQ
jgi:pimeloyl-ACP methyl ester carboxylesterase